MRAVAAGASYDLGEDLHWDLHWVNWPTDPFPPPPGAWSCLSIINYFVFLFSKAHIHRPEKAQHWTWVSTVFVFLFWFVLGGGRWRHYMLTIPPPPLSASLHHLPLTLKWPSSLFIRRKGKLIVLKWIVCDLTSVFLQSSSWALGVFKVRTHTVKSGTLLCMVTREELEVVLVRCIDSEPHWCPCIQTICLLCTFE